MYFKIANWNLARYWPPWDRLSVIFLMFLMLCIVLTGCEGGSFRSDSRASVPPESTSPGASNQNTGTDSESLVIDPMVPPDVVENMLKARQGSATTGTSTEVNSSGLPIARSLGIKADLLFAAPLKDSNERMARLENAVVDIRRELDSTLPAINRLVAIEGDIQELVRQLQTLTIEGGDISSSAVGTSDVIAPLDPTTSIPIGEGVPLTMSPPLQPSSAVENTNMSSVTAKPTPILSGPTPPVEEGAPSVISPSFLPAVAPPKVIKPRSVLPDVKSTPVDNQLKTVTSVPAISKNPPPNSLITSQGVGISDQKPLPVVPATRQVKLAGIRVGAHADKVRIVIDSAKPITVIDDLDPVEKILVLDIDGADVDTAQGPGGANDVVSRISLRGTGPGLGQAVFELKKKTKVQKISSLPPSVGNPNYRTVIDLEK